MADLVMKRPPLSALRSALDGLNEAASESLFRAMAETQKSDVLRAICFDNGLPFAGRTAALVETLCAAVRPFLTCEFHLTVIKGSPL